MHTQCNEKTIRTGRASLAAPLREIVLDLGATR